MNVFSVVFGAAVGLLGFFMIIRQVQRNRMPTAHHGARSQPSGEPEPKLCEVCEIPQMKNGADWKALECGHCYHAKCYEQLGASSCFSCHLASMYNA